MAVAVAGLEDVGETIQFNASVQPFTGQPPYIYYWAFGDGGTSNALNPTHEYTTAGEYTYTFTVTDQAGETATETGTITISSQGDGSNGSSNKNMLIFLAILAVIIIVGIVIIVLVVLVYQWWARRKK